MQIAAGRTFELLIIKFVNTSPSQNFANQTPKTIICFCHGDHDIAIGSSHPKCPFNV